MEKTYKVTGMHCPSCEIILKDDFEELGVKVKEVSHKSGVLKVEFDDKKVPEAKIKKVVTDNGYKVN